MENRDVRIEHIGPLCGADCIELNDADHRGAGMPDGRVPLRELLSAQGTKDSNRLKILRVIMAKPGNQAYLAKWAGLSQSTVSGAVTDLVSKRYVVRPDKPDKEAGKGDKDAQKAVVSLTATTGAAVGVELGFHHTAVVARRVEQSPDQARTATVGAGAAHGTHRWLPDVANAIRDAVADLGEDDIVAIGLGIPRIVEPRSGTLLDPVLPPWTYGDDPAHMLLEELRKGGGSMQVSAPRVVIDNDANLAALAEATYHYDNVASLVAIKASTGIGAGIIIGGQIIRGARGAAGEIGHVIVDRHGQFCPCGGRGCLETVIGADALLEQARTSIAGRRQKIETLAELIALARGGHPTCQRVLREAATTLGEAIGNLCNVLNPEVVVLGGAFGRQDAVDYTLGPCREALSRSGLQAAVEGACETANRKDPEDKRLRVEASTLEYAAAHGALVLALRGTEYDSPK
jgi:predicted NBD/HSP70 family sugar kinase